MEIKLKPHLLLLLVVVPAVDTLTVFDKFEQKNNKRK